MIAAAEAAAAEVAVAAFPYKKIDLLFTEAERSFLGVLKKALTGKVEIFGKVRVADVLGVETGLSPSDKQIAFNKISAKHFDFVLCDKKTLGILCVIELDDRSHNAKKRQERDAFLVKACEAANMPFIQFKAKQGYAVHDVRVALANILPDTLPDELPNTFTNTGPEITPEPTLEIAIEKTLEQVPEEKLSTIGQAAEQSPLDSQKTCPKCASNMVLRVASKGKNKGGSFWGCSAYPKCRYMESDNNNDDTLFEQ